MNGRDGLVRENLEGLDVLEARDEPAPRLVDLQGPDDLIAGRERDEEQVVRVPCARRRVAPAAVDPAGILGRLLAVELEQMTRRELTVLTPTPGRLARVVALDVFGRLAPRLAVRS